MNNKPNWMTAKEQAEMKPTKARKAKKPPKEKVIKPAWTVVTRVFKSEAKRARFAKRVISHLKFRGRRVHSLAGPLSESTLKATAASYNLNGYTPETASVRLYCEMNDSDRLKLAQEHSPQLL